jgi:hypothetical protein
MTAFCNKSISSTPLLEMRHEIRRTRKSFPTNSTPRTQKLTKRSSRGRGWTAGGRSNATVATVTTWAHIHTYTSTHAHARMHIHIGAQTHIHIHVHTCTYMRKRTHAHDRAHMETTYIVQGHPQPPTFRTRDMCVTVPHVCITRIGGVRGTNITKDRALGWGLRRRTNQSRHSGPHRPRTRRIPKAKT